MDRLVNYFFLFTLVLVFVLATSATGHEQMFIGGFLATMICGCAFLAGWLTLDGARAAAIFGTLVFSLGGIPAASVVLLFFFSSSLISQKDSLNAGMSARDYIERERRDGLQVWSNGFWFSLFLLFGYLFDSELLWIGAVGSMAVATADTWATELGSRRFNVKTYVINGLNTVKPGTEGGISIPGTVAAALGSAAISILAIYVFTLQRFSFFAIFMAGFLGCLADSYLGETLQQENRCIPLFLFGKTAYIVIDNNMVNWIAAGIGSFLAIILNILLI